MASSSSYMNLPLQINQTFAGPLEKKTVFDSRSEANEWLAGAYAYEGALVRIKDSGKWKIYLVQNNDGVLEFEEYTSGESGTAVLDEVDLLPTDLKKVSADEIIDKVNEVIITLSTKVKVDIDPLGNEESEDEGGEILRSGKKSSSSLNIDNVTLGDAVYKLNELISKLSTNKPDPTPEENEEER